MAGLPMVGKAPTIGEEEADGDVRSVLLLLSPLGGEALSAFSAVAVARTATTLLSTDCVAADRGKSRIEWIEDISSAFRFFPVVFITTPAPPVSSWGSPSLFCTEGFSPSIPGPILVLSSPVAPFLSCAISRFNARMVSSFLRTDSSAARRRCCTDIIIRFCVSTSFFLFSSRADN